jgi:cyanophycinase
VKQGTIIAIGGNEDKSGAAETLLHLFVERAGGASARIVVVPFASEAPRERGRAYARIFRDLGAAKVTVACDCDGSVDVSAFADATGIFVTGGDQEKLMLLLNRRGWVESIRAAVARGAVYAGTSAGAAAVAETMIVGGGDGASDHAIRLVPGLGLRKLLVDQHFTERARMPRLLSAIAETGSPGIGIDENTAVVFDGDAVRVLGSGRVTLVRREIEAVVVEPGDEIEID